MAAPELRFSPASAGNTADRGSSATPFAVQPRERGEHIPYGFRSRLRDGSAPRARGTLGRLIKRIPHRRFSPASAENTLSRNMVPMVIPVHPRERGEHDLTANATAMPQGSAPRARGTLWRGCRVVHGSRFSPASAGNTGPPAPARTRAAVQPRERGEHQHGRSGAIELRGSAPRARGTRPVSAVRDLLVRFSPASAGNTSVARWPGCWCSVQPRERGEHESWSADWQIKNGSAPRAREHTLEHHGLNRAAGSAPRARGTRHAAPRRCADGRFSPASAGNTRPLQKSSRKPTVQPRERGEHAA